MSRICRRAMLVLLPCTLVACDPTEPGISVEIVAPAPTGQFGTEPYVAMKAGESVQFAAEIRDSDGTLIEGDVEWDVRNEAFLSIDASGLARARSYVEACGTARPPHCGVTAAVARVGTAVDTMVVITLPPTLLLEVAPRDTTVLRVGESAEFTLVASMPPEPELWFHCRTPDLRPQMSGVVDWETVSSVTEYPDGVWVMRSVYRATATAPGVTGLDARVLSTYCSDQEHVGEGPPPAIRVVE